MFEEVSINPVLEDLSKLVNDNEVYNLGKILIGAILSDGEVHENEVLWLPQFYHYFKEAQKYRAEFDQIIEEKRALSFPSNFNFESNSAKIKVLELVVQICSCDLDLDMNEIYFINQSADSLEIRDPTSKQLILESGYRAKIEAFDKFCSRLESSYASKLMNDINHILTDHGIQSKIFEDVLLSLDYAVNNNTKEPYEVVTDPIPETVISFLIEGSHLKENWDEKIDNCILALAIRQKLNASQYSWLKQNVKTSFNLLIQ
jgi:hypothetical protein